MAAIYLSQPTMEEPRLRQYAEIVREECRVRNIDPYTIISIVHHESRWIASAVDAHGCIGLGQHCLSNYPYCRQNYQSAECQEKKQKLLDGIYNLRETGLSITRWRKFCMRKTGHAELHQWLAAYQGYNEPYEHIWCGQKRVNGRWQDVLIGKATEEVLQYRRKLIG